MMTEYLIGLDGSALAEAALPLAEHLARANNGRLILVRAIPDGELLEPIDAAQPNVYRYVAPEGTRNADPVATLARAREADEYLTRLAHDLRRRGVSAETLVVPGDPADVLKEEARLRHADVIVLTIHGRSGVGRLVYGSVAETVLASTSLPVLLVHVGMSLTTPHAESAPLRVLVPVDGSPVAETVLPLATKLATALAAEVFLVRIVPSAAPPAGRKISFERSHTESRQNPERHEAQSYLDEIAHELHLRGLSVHSAIGIGSAADGILAAAEACDASFVVMATHGRTGVARAILGSVALDVLQRGSRPVLVVPPLKRPWVANQPVSALGGGDSGSCPTE